MKVSASRLTALLAVALVCSASATIASSATAQTPVKAVGRVRLPATGPEICESARKARERNSPAAPGLERQCQAALQAARDSAAATATSATICESARKARERNSPAAPGLEARCSAMRASEVRSATSPIGGAAGSTVPGSAAPGPVTPIKVISNVFISQVYGGAGVDGGLTHDYVELFNGSNAPVDVGGWAVQYASAAGTVWQVTPLRGSIAPGGYYLVQQAGVGTLEPTMPGYGDAIGTISMAAVAGKVALTQNTTPLSVACPGGAAVVDRVSYGVNTTPAGCAIEWGGRTENLSNTTAAYRDNDGCAHTGSNADDFTVLAANPRNSASPAMTCGDGGAEAATPVATPNPYNVFISQVYGGGGSAGAVLTHDYIEIFNGSNTPVDVTGWAVQYASSAGNAWQVTPLRGMISPGGYYLVREAAGGMGDAPMAGFADATGAISMSMSSGKVALTQNAVALTAACPSGAAVIDRVSYGENTTTTGCGAEWGGRTGILSSTTAAYRNNDGCVYTGSNSADFTVLAASPRNTASPPKSCAPDDK
jgi:hypothetical protein